MPITPSALRTVRKPCGFQYGADTVNLEYYPVAVGADIAATLNSLMAKANAAETEAESDASLHELGEWLSTVIAWWDYNEDDGETMQPLTPENLAQQVLQFTDFMRSVLIAIIEDRNRGNASGTPSSVNSGATSSPTAPSASMRASLNQSASSSSHAGSKARQHSNGSPRTRTGTSGQTSAG